MTPQLSVFWLLIRTVAPTGILAIFEAYSGRPASRQRKIWVVLVAARRALTGCEEASRLRATQSRCAGMPLSLPDRAPPVRDGAQRCRARPDLSGRHRGRRQQTAATAVREPASISACLLQTIVAVRTCLQLTQRVLRTRTCVAGQRHNRRLCAPVSCSAANRDLGFADPCFRSVAYERNVVLPNATPHARGKP